MGRGRGVIGRRGGFSRSPMGETRAHEHVRSASRRARRGAASDRRRSRGGARAPAARTPSSRPSDGNASRAAGQAVRRPLADPRVRPARCWRVRRARGAHDRPRLPAGRRRSSRSTPSGTPTRPCTDWLASNRSSSLDDASYVGSSIGDIPFIPALVILDGARRCDPAPLARRRVHRRRDPRRGRDLSRDQPDRAPRASRRCRAWISCRWIRAIRRVTSPPRSSSTSGSRC